MCNFLSLIVTRDDKIFYTMNNNSHECLIDEYNLDDNDLIDRDFVRIEIKPMQGMFSRDKGDWHIRVDEEGTLPVWFEEEQRKIYNNLRGILDNVFDSIHLVVKDPKNIPEAKIANEMFEKVRLHKLDIFWAERMGKEISDDDKGFKKADEILNDLDDDLYCAVAEWFEDKELSGFFDDWIETPFVIAMCIKNKSKVVEDILNEYMVALEAVYKLIK